MSRRPPAHGVEPSHFDHLAVADRLQVTKGMKPRSLAPLLLLVLAPSIPRTIGACSLAARHGTWWEEVQPGDTTGPTNLTAGYSVDRPDESDGGGVGCTASCGSGPAYVVLDVSATDDATPRERIGYKFAIVGGQPPKNLDYTQVYAIDTYSETGGEIGLWFDRDAGAFSFDLEITAVDTSGNESTPIVIAIDG